MSLQVVWFKRDLRVRDHAPLVAAAALRELRERRLRGEDAPMTPQRGLFPETDP